MPRSVLALTLFGMATAVLLLWVRRRLRQLDGMEDVQTRREWRLVFQLATVFLVCGPLTNLALFLITGQVSGTPLGYLLRYLRRVFKPLRNEEIAKQSRQNWRSRAWPLPRVSSSGIPTGIC